ncbi:MAG: NUDIX domain-containing protein [Sphingobacteriia bacterium]|nr:NUDIX domain-containing protein [Sphingobacteriia bacterium]
MMDSIHIITRAIITSNNHLLVCFDPRRPQNDIYYYLPGGHVEHGESVETSVIRELKEETGFEFTIEKFLGVFEHYFNPISSVKVCHNHEYNFLFKVNSKEMHFKSLLPQIESHVNFKWINLNELNNIRLLPSKLITLIPELLEHNHNSTLYSVIE